MATQIEIPHIKDLKYSQQVAWVKCTPAPHKKSYDKYFTICEPVPHKVDLSGEGYVFLLLLVQHSS